MEILAYRDPEHTRRLLDTVLEHMMEAVHRYEGTVNQLRRGNPPCESDALRPEDADARRAGLRSVVNMNALRRRSPRHWCPFP